MKGKIDPIRGKYFDPLESAESWFRWLFYVTAAVAVTVLLIDKQTCAFAYTVLQILFAILTIATSVLSVCMRLYLGSRAHRSRVADFLSRAFTVDLTAERTEKYYNSNAIDPARRMILQLLENCFFTKDIARLMCRRSRTTAAIYLVVLIAAIIFRRTPIDVTVVLCQVVFGEAVLSAWFRLEWLRMAAERIYDATYKQFKTLSGDTPFQMASAIEALLDYECHKASASITLASGIFDENNRRLSSEWEVIRERLESG